ncbi:AAHS family 4-hydroxybenzoate transporter-like MFS transporter [Crenobacter luteus]|uniref:MFS transporter n=1 Tax=Crenobacter luteus TaxID=1452487 RepID=UPI0010444779|nr:MFS transporter [Crenobacter luteus]TCP14564.1 AAHS family 4-hydroxybenzoate transporter-like MFS transporter [Crenobacter luteus]
MQQDDKKTVDAQALIDSQPFSRYQYLILFFCFSILALDGMDTAAIGYVAPALVAEWGIERAALAPALSAALFGLAFGAMVAGPSADRFGRKPVLVVSTAFFGVLSLLTAYAYDVASLALLRFLTGLGLGAAMPNAVTLMAELAPANRRSFVINTVYVGFPLGAAAGGFVSAWLIPHFGWQSIFVLGGVLPLALLPFLVRSLPESVSYMTSKGHPVDKVRRVLERVCGRDLGDVERFELGERQSPVQAGGSALGLILSRPFLLSTLMLWTTYFMGLLIFYLLTSWMPLMMKDAGFSIEKAALLTAIFPLGGGIGTLVSGLLMDRFNPGRVLSFVYVLAAVLLVAVGQTMDKVFVFAGLIFLAGIMVTGAQASLPALAAPIYPTRGRATGMAWMLGVGRFGGIAGALLGGVLLGMQLPFGQILVLLAIPAVVAMLALWVLSSRTACKDDAARAESRALTGVAGD